MFDPASIDPADLSPPDRSAYAAARAARVAAPSAGMQASAEGLAQSMRWPWTAVRDALYHSMIEAAGGWSLPYAQEETHLKNIIWAFLIHHDRRHLTFPRQTTDGITLPALIGDRAGLVDAALQWAETAIPFDAGYRARMDALTAERHACLLAHGSTLPDVLPDEDEDAADDAETDPDTDADPDEDAAFDPDAADLKKKPVPQGSPASIWPPATPVCTGPETSTPPSDSPADSLTAPCPASGTSGTDGNASTAAAQSSLQRPPRGSGGGMLSSGGEGARVEGLEQEGTEETEIREWCILWLGKRGWTNLEGTLCHAVREAQSNMGDGFLIVPFSPRAEGYPPSVPSVPSCSNPDQAARSAAAVSHPEIFNAFDPRSPRAFPIGADDDSETGY